MSSDARPAACEILLLSSPGATNAAAVLPWGASPRMREASAGRSPSLDECVPKMGTCQERATRRRDLRVMSSRSPVFAGHHNAPESHKHLKHDRDLPASSCSWFVTPRHPISDLKGTLRSPGNLRGTLRLRRVQVGQETRQSAHLLVAMHRKRMTEGRPSEHAANRRRVSDRCGPSSTVPRCNVSQPESAVELAAPWPWDR